MAKFEILGGFPISGTHIVSGNKNAALPMIAAALLTDETVTLTNVPDIEDVRWMLTGIKELGAKVLSDVATHTVTIKAAKLKKNPEVNPKICSVIRTSILFAAPLLARRGQAKLSAPGGDVIGRRRLDTHINGLKALGATVSIRKNYIFRSSKLTGSFFMLDEASVTATENLIMAAVLATGTTTLYNTACEPHICDLCKMLNKMGAKISGIGTNRLTIEGVKKMFGGTFSVGPDFIEAASYIVASVVTGGVLRLQNIRRDDFIAFETAFRKFGVRWNWENETSLLVPARQKLKMEYDLGDVIPQFADGVWPMIPSDLISVMIVLATQTRGTALFFEKMYESRMYFVDHLIGMGARIVQCDPHRVVVTGPSSLQGGTVSSPDIRAGMALLIAALCSKRRTVIGNARVVDRGYEKIDEQLRSLGAHIQRIPDE